MEIVGRRGCPLFLDRLFRIKVMPFSTPDTGTQTQMTTAKTAIQAKQAAIFSATQIAGVPIQNNIDAAMRKVIVLDIDVGIGVLAIKLKNRCRRTASHGGREAGPPTALGRVSPLQAPGFVLPPAEKCHPAAPTSQHRVANTTAIPFKIETSMLELAHFKHKIIALTGIATASGVRTQ